MQALNPSATVVAAASELHGPALAWATILAMGRSPTMAGGRVEYRTDHGSWISYQVDNASAAELCDRFWIGLDRPSKGQNPPTWRALADNARQKGRADVPGVVSAYDVDMAVAVHRAFVLSRLGETATIPAALVSTPAAVARDEVVPSAEAAHLTPLEKDWLVRMATARLRELDARDGVPTRVINSLIRKGLIERRPGEPERWGITEAGTRRCTTIY